MIKSLRRRMYEGKMHVLTGVLGKFPIPKQVVLSS